MILNYFEESTIENHNLPPSWREQDVLNELETFLQDNWNLRNVYYDDDKQEKKQQFISFLSHKAIRTNQYIGTIMFNGEQVNVFPKMFCASKNEKDNAELDSKHLMKNLIRWLEYCSKTSYPFININTNLEDEESLKELFITLYVSYVRKAIERGAYYQYVDETNDIGYIKGKFDICDYYLKKYQMVKRISLDVHIQNMSMII